MPVDERELHREFFLSRQQPDGGFPGREGGSDLYYTAFALRGLALLGEAESVSTERTANFLREQAGGKVSVIDLISLVFAAQLLETWAGVSPFADLSADWPQLTLATLEKLRRPDGGYAKTVEGHASSTYQTFLTALAYQLLETPLPDASRAIEFVLGQQREDGGFVEVGVMRSSGSNPTAAAVGVLKVLQPQVGRELLTAELQESVTDFLTGVVSAEGGFCANSRIPMADLLSTYTGLQTLQDVAGWEEVNTAAALEYVRALQDEKGGFRAATWDDAVDVEYSFYGVATLGLLLGVNLK